MRYVNAAGRDASIPVPVDGDVAWLQTEDLLTIYAGIEWLPYYPHEHSHNGASVVTSVGSTQDLISATDVHWPTNMNAGGTVPAGMTRLTATCVVSQAQAVSADANHAFGLALDGVLLSETRVRFVQDQIGDVAACFGTRPVVPGAAFQIQAMGRAVGGGGGLRITSEKVNFIDWRFSR